MLIVSYIFALLTVICFIATMNTYNTESKHGYLNNFFPGVIFTAICGAISAGAAVIHLL